MRRALCDSCGEVRAINAVELIKRRMKHKVPIGIDMQMQPMQQAQQAEKGGETRARARVYSLLCIPMNYEDEADVRSPSRRALWSL